MRAELHLLTSADVPAAMRLTDDAGWNQTVADWTRLLTASPEGCFAAHVDGRLAGTVTTIRYEDRFAWIGMVIVHDALRGQGIGTALLQEALDHLTFRHLPCVKLDATPRGRPLYEKLGFEPEEEIERWQLTREPRVAADTDPTDLGPILEPDRIVFGADRALLLRSIAREAPELVIVEQNGAHAGYALGRHGSLTDHLGPWVASSEPVAANLLDAFLRRSSRARIFVDCPASHPWATELVRQRGFVRSRSLTRMFRGSNTFSGDRDRRCAIVGPEFG
jgi:GNAT superfamily N-acetyltransferase